MSQSVMTSEVPVPPWWTSRAGQIDEFLQENVTASCLYALATTPGGRRVSLAAYGQPEPELRGPANFNSAMAAQDPDAYFRRGDRRRPCLLVLAGVHGAEVEGMIGGLSVIRMVETGKDLAGREQAALADKLRRLRLVVIPLANPDGRARVPQDGWLGLPTAEMHRVGQGTRRDGSLYNWPGCKRVHPMEGDVGVLGGYYDDAGVNMMHDEWSEPMSDTTRRLLRLIAREAPDVALNCHSCPDVPKILPAAYVPRNVEEEIIDFARRCYAGFDAAGLPHAADLPRRLSETPADAPPPSLNLTSMIHHVGAAVAMTFESPHGLVDQPGGFSYLQILDAHHVLVETAADGLLAGRGD